MKTHKSFCFVVLEWCLEYARRWDGLRRHARTHNRVAFDHGEVQSYRSRGSRGILERCVHVAFPQGDGTVCFFIFLNWHLIWQPKGGFDSGRVWQSETGWCMCSHLTSRWFCLPRTHTYEYISSSFAGCTCMFVVVLFLLLLFVFLES